MDSKLRSAERAWRHALRKVELKPTLARILTVNAKLAAMNVLRERAGRPLIWEGNDYRSDEPLQS